MASDIIEAADPCLAGRFARSAADELGVPLVAFAHSDLATVLQARCGAAIGSLACRCLRAFYAQFDRVIAHRRIATKRLDCWREGAATIVAAAPSRDEIVRSRHIGENDSACLLRVHVLAGVF